ncbi:multidrug ABC transporter ATPase [uncultured archaeon]|nr:multidrug ABC transporter ATPase [uncultured archaeon]HKJ97026.1 ABC transporter ATP-binding protein [Thermoplasmataceae archaeon]
MIRTDEIVKRYRNGTVALHGITLDLDERVTAVIGMNGAGKTTLIRILSTQLEPTSGKAEINGLDIMKNASQIRKNIVSIPQEASPIGILTPFEHVKLYLVGRGMSMSEAERNANISLDQLELREFKHKPSDTLSGGMKRKVFVAMALSANVDTIFLDEPTTGLDPLSRMEVWSAIRQLEGNVILTTHYMDEAHELSDEVVMIHGGKVLEKGNVKSLLSRFKGLVRVETTVPQEKGLQIGRLYIKYVKEEDAEKYLGEGYNIKRITLDDLFISRGMALES